MEESETAELLMGVLRELKDLKQMVAKNTKQLYDLQATVDAMTNKSESYTDILFPAKTQEAFDELEEMMQDGEGREYVTMQLRSVLKKEDDMWLLQIIDENLVEDYNLVAKRGKRGLLSYSIIEYALQYLNANKRTLSYCMKVTKDKLLKRKQRREKSLNQSVVASKQELPDEEADEDDDDS